MGIKGALKKARKKLAKVAKEAKEAAKKSAEIAAKVTVAPVTVQLDIVKETVGIIADVEDKVKNIVGTITEEIAGEEARKIMEDLIRVANPVNYHTTENLLESIQQVLEHGDIEYINPLVGILAGELESTQEQYWNRAHIIPVEVTSKMPSDMQNLILHARYIDVAETSNLSLPAIATNHLKKARAIAVHNLIFFDGVPGTSENSDLHLWAHEIFHVKQYADLSVIGFAKKYIYEELTKNSKGNNLELEADRFACKLFPVPNPTYLNRPCPKSYFPPWLNKRE